MSNVSQFPPVTRERRIYSDTLEMMERVFYGAGIGATRIDLIRCDNKANNRVLFHPTIDKKQIFDEPVTIEHIQSFIKGAEAMKHAVVLKGGTEGLLAIPPGHIQAGSVSRFESSSIRDVVAVVPAPAPQQMAAKAKSLPATSSSSTKAKDGPGLVRRWAGNANGSRATQGFPVGRKPRTSR